MKKPLTATLKQALTALLLTAVTFAAHAQGEPQVLSAVTVNAHPQKQPQIQEISVRAPDNVRVDGKMNEWASPYLAPSKTEGYLQAYNSSSRIYYTVANDDNNLYFVIRGLGGGVSQKFISGGLTITISRATDKKREKAKDNVVLTFPIAQDEKTTTLVMNSIGTAGSYVDMDSVKFRRQIDSVNVISNKLITDAMKEIRVAGIKEITDSTVSIYNTEGIKAAIKFIKRQPIVEFAIPLKYLGLSVENPVKFSYNIWAGAVPEPKQQRQDVAVGVVYAPPVIMSGGGGGMMPPPSMPVNNNAGFLFNPTDFWGIYTLAKKP